MGDQQLEVDLRPLFLFRLHTFQHQRVLLEWLIFGGPCRGQTYGPLIKRCPVDQTQQTHEHLSEHKHKKSE